jgi:hypothetical protein
MFRAQEHSQALDLIKFFGVFWGIVLLFRETTNAKYFLPFERPPSHSAEAFQCNSLVQFSNSIEQ